MWSSTGSIRGLSTKKGCSFRSSHSRPAVGVVCDLGHEVSSIVHRGLFGWARADAWNVDAHIARVLPELLRCLADHCPGYPLWMDSPADQRGEGSTSPSSDVPLIHAMDTGDAEADAGISRQAHEYWRQWLRDRAQAFDDGSQLRLEGGVDRAPLSRRLLGYDVCCPGPGARFGSGFRSPGPLDALSDEEKQAALHAWDKKMLGRKVSCTISLITLKTYGTDDPSRTRSRVGGGVSWTAPNAIRTDRQVLSTTRQGL